MFSPGYTLLDFLLVLFIQALLLSIITQTYHFNQIKSTIEILELKQMLQTARLSALLSNHPLYLCPTNNSQICQQNWFNNIAIKQIINHIHSNLTQPLSLSTGHTQFNHGNKLFITNKIIHHQTNGTLSYLNNNHNSILNKKIIINVLGRIRVN